MDEKRKIAELMHENDIYYFNSEEESNRKQEGLEDKIASSPSVRDPMIACGECTDEMNQRIDSIERRLKTMFPEQGIRRFEALELLDHTDHAGDYVLNILSKTERDKVILFNGLEKLLFSKSAQKLFLELYFSWHASGKFIFITTVAPLDADLGWNEKLLQCLGRGNVFQV